MAGANIKLMEVSKAYNDKYVVDNVSMQIDAGDFLTILGPSGAGKTTVLKMIAGFIDPSDGKILLEGRDISRVPTHKRNIGMLFQNYALFPHMTVHDNVAFPLSVRRYPAAEKEKMIQEMLERVKLAGYGNRYPRELSGGQQQRVGLARALVFNPPLLLLDEPMAALDKQLRKHMQLEIKQLHNELGLTTISVTHDQEDALTMATKVCVMHDGKVEQMASPHEIYERPKNVFVAKFIGEANVLPGIVAKHGDGIVSVRLEDGTVLPVADNKYVYFEEEKVAVVIRPEKFRRVDDSWSGFRISGKVEQLVYVGEALKLTVFSRFKEKLVIKIFTTSAVSVSVGDTFTFGVDPEDIVLVKDSPKKEA